MNVKLDSEDKSDGRILRRRNLIRTNLAKVKSVKVREGPEAP